jgi:3,2-trans-enoyl-CoA isomerase
MVTVELSPETGIATLQMHRFPANSLSLEMCRAISDAIATAEADKKTQALIVSSSLPNGIFSAGLELTELYQPDPARLPQFWESFQQLYFDLYGSHLSTVAAIGGPAPAAGCMLALSCDYRVMTTNPKSTIGLNESQLGIVAPPWLCQQYIDTIGNRNAELALLLGTLFSPPQALEIGLVDELHENVDEAARNKAADFVRIPPKARVAAKDLTRGTQIQKLEDNRDEDTEFFCSFVTADAVQRTLGAYLEMLAKRNK